MKLEVELDVVEAMDVQDKEDRWWYGQVSDRFGSQIVHLGSVDLVPRVKSKVVPRR